MMLLLTRFSCRLNYEGKDFSEKPSQIHEEFGLLIEDLINNSPSADRMREPVPWRKNASKEYVRRAMRHQSNKPDYEEHKIAGGCLRKKLN